MGLLEKNFRRNTLREQGGIPWRVLSALHNHVLVAAKYILLVEELLAERH